TIASKIGELALQKGAKSITQDLLIEGYIIGTPKRDHRFLRKKLKEKNIDVAPFEPYFKMSKADYKQNWKSRYKLVNEKKLTLSRDIFSTIWSFFYTFFNS